MPDAPGTWSADGGPRCSAELEHRCALRSRGRLAARAARGWRDWGLRSCSPRHPPPPRPQPPGGPRSLSQATRVPPRGTGPVTDPPWVSASPQARSRRRGAAHHGRGWALAPEGWPTPAALSAAPGAPRRPPTLSRPDPGDQHRPFRRGAQALPVRSSARVPPPGGSYVQRPLAVLQSPSPRRLRPHRAQKATVSGQRSRHATPPAQRMLRETRKLHLPQSQGCPLRLRGRTGVQQGPFAEAGGRDVSDCDGAVIPATEVERAGRPKATGVLHPLGLEAQAPQAQLPPPPPPGRGVKGSDRGAGDGSRSSRSSGTRGAPP